MGKWERNHCVSIPPWFDSNPSSHVFLHRQGACFNPTVVRFKRCSSGMSKPVISAFQSHRGSIQTIMPGYHWTMPVTVSIPPWFDSNQVAVTKILPRTGSFNPTVVRFKLKWCTFDTRLHPMFQSHRGSIQTNSTNSKPNALSEVSIPPWFDSNNCGGDRIRTYSARFQSHRGSIQTLRHNHGPHWCEKFQSHRGSIQTCQTRQNTCYSGSVSIPPWFDSNQYHSSS